VDEFEKYLTKAMRFLKFRPRSEKEIRDYLLRPPRKRRSTHLQTISPELLERVINALKEQKFIDDEAFARWWVEQRTKFRPKGMRLIALELKQKGVARDVIDTVLENQEPGSKNQDALAQQLVAKKIVTYHDLPRREVYQKLGAFLARRGFDWETIKKAIDEILDNRV